MEQTQMAEVKERTIVIAMDGSKHSDYALDVYMKNVHRKGDHVILVHIPEFHTVVSAPMPALPDATVFADMWRQEEKKANAFAEQLGHKLTEHQIGGKVISRRGIPGNAICEVAKEQKADLIVTGTRGLGTIRRTLLGSISDYILHHAHCPVLIAKQGPSEDHHHHQHHS